MAIRRRIATAWGRFAATCAAIFLAVGLVALNPTPARADCAIGDTSCINVDVTSGEPGTLVTMLPFGPVCRPEGNNYVAFVSGDFDPDASYPTAQLEMGFQGEARTATFRVPETEPGTYRLALTCDFDPTIDQEFAGDLLGFTFTVLAMPGTDTSPALTASGSDAFPVLFLIGLLVFAAVLIGGPRTFRRPVRGPAASRCGSRWP